VYMLVVKKKVKLGAYCNCVAVFTHKYCSYYTCNAILILGVYGVSTLNSLVLLVK
jgi:hypothetical protein